MTAVWRIAQGKAIPASDITATLRVLFAPGDRVVLEGNNQKQTDFLSHSLTRVSPERLHDLYMIMPSVSCVEHPDISEAGIAHKLDFSFAGPQSLRISQLLADGLLEVGVIHAYIELHARLVVDLIPSVSLVAGFRADHDGDIYIGPSTEDMPALAKPAVSSDGVVIVQVNEIVDDAIDLPHVDTPGLWVDFIMQANKPSYIEPLFTRDPHPIKSVHVLMTMTAIRNICQWHNVQSLGHGIGFNTAAIELIPSTYGERLDLKGKIYRNWTLNSHPTLIPAIGFGRMESAHCFGTELGMERHVAARPDMFFTGRDGLLRSNRMLYQLAGQYAADLFIGATLQVDGDGHSFTATYGRLAGSGGAPNMGHDSCGRRHATSAWLGMMKPVTMLECDEKLVVQMVETFQEGGKPIFVDTLDVAVVVRQDGMPLAPIMIYGDDVTHLLTEDGIAYFYKVRSLDEWRAMVAMVVGAISIGLWHDLSKTEQICRDGLIAPPKDFDVRRNDVSRELPATKNIADLVEWSGGLYDPPAHFRSW